VKYLHVANKAYKAGVKYDQAIMRQAGSCLYSLIEGLRQKDFGFHTLNGVMKNIRGYKDLCVNPVGGSLFTDSGGYSIIRGDVHPTDIPRFIECYDLYLEEERQTYEYIFSLDIPLSLKFRGLNTKALIYEYNRQSLQDAKNIMIAHPEIQEKFYFVWQFKMLDQYVIWQRLFDQLGFSGLTRNYALGGMVGLRGITKIDYSPFIPMAFKCLHEWQAGGLGGEFRLHFLGMYIRYDRFQIALLEQLFRRYLAEGQTVAMSYDSINFAHTARLNTTLNYFAWQGGNLEVHQKPSVVPQDIWMAIYDTPKLQQAFLEGVEAREADRKLQSTNTFAPLNIYSNKCLDAFFEHVVETSGLVDMFIGEKNYNRFATHSGQVLKGLAKQHREVFTPRMVKSVTKNLLTTFKMHHWHENDGHRTGLERLVTQEIQNLNFPYHLS